MGNQNDNPYTHRLWKKAAALGINPELGGYDSSYQSAGIGFAAYYYAVCPDPTMRAKVFNMIKRGLDWEITRFNADGSAVLTGNTRVFEGTTQINPGGETKTFDYRSSFEALVSGYKLTGNQAYYDTAKHIAQYTSVRL